MNRHRVLGVTASLIASFLALLITIPLPVVAAQYGRPDGDVTVGGWEDTTGGDGDGYLWDEIDEVTADDGTTYIRADSSASTSEVTLSDVTDPEVSTGHIMRFRAYATGGAAPERVRQQLFEGATQRAQSDNFAITRGSWNDYTYTLTGAEADSITDYTNLRFRFIPDASGSDTVDVTWAELEVPDAPTGGGCQDLTVDTVDPAGQEWFNGTTDQDPGDPLFDEENVSASFQTDSTSAINVTNDDTGDNCDVTLQLQSAPSSGRTMKYNTTKDAPNPGANTVPSASNVTVCQSIAPSAVCSVWLWVDYDDAAGGGESITLIVDTKAGT